MKFLLNISLVSTIVLTCALSAAEFTTPTPLDAWISHWLIGGPYPNYQVNDQGTGLDSDFLDRESTARPYPGQTTPVIFTADQSKLIAGIGSSNEWGYNQDQTFTVIWRVMNFDRPERITLDKAFLPIDDYFVYYAACWLESPVVQTVQFRLGSDDDHKFYLNQEQLGRVATSQDIIKDNFIYTGQLRQGMNSILLKIVDRTGGTGFCFRITDQQGNPQTDLKIYTDDPRRQLQADAYMNNFAASFEFATPDLFTDSSHSLKLHFHAPDTQKYQLQLGNNITEMSNGIWELTPKLNEGKNQLQLQVTGADKTLAVLEHTVTLYSRDKLRQENIKLQAEFEVIQRQQAQFVQQFADNNKIIENLQLGLTEARQNAEKRFAAEREEAVKTARKSQPELFTGLGTRSRLLLNGAWKIGTSRDQIDGNIYLPAPLYNSFFRTWYNPLVKVDSANSDAVEAMPGWDDYHFDQRICENELWFSREIEIDQSEIDLSELTAFFVSEHIYGKVIIYVNGVECGVYGGRIGIVEIPLVNLQRGKNLLEIHFTAPGKAFNYFVNGKYGLQGDMYIDFVSPIRTADVWVKTSWRKAQLSTETTVENRTDKNVNFLLRQYAISDKQIHYRLPDQIGELTAQQSLTLTVNDAWADPEFWHIADPHLYELVSDLYVNDKLVDRKRDSFGFREFWIHATDFYFNGKHTILQGDVGHADWNNAKLCDVAWPLYRHDGINILRIHDSSYWSKEFVRRSDQLGMFAYAQMYPVLHQGNPDQKNYLSIDAWLQEPLHQFNLDNYRAWHKMLRNHPAVIIYSTDNEILTQAWDTLEQVDFNLRNDKLGAMYGQFVKSLDPDIVLTRDGDIGTWNSQGRWFEDPPCDTANYHYPDFNPDQWVKNWQSVYEYRPVIFGETLYCSYGAMENLGARPDIVAKKAELVRKIASLYRIQSIPAQIYMGLGLDGFLQLKSDGSGSPWAVPGSTPAEVNANAAKLPPGRLYPWREIKWPARSGKGQRPLAQYVRIETYADRALNWFDPSVVSHVRNPVNDAYRDSLLTQPVLVANSDAEIVIKANPGTQVWSESQGERYGVIADSEGLAWFQFASPGQYSFQVKEVKMDIAVQSRAEYAAKPGFAEVKIIALKP